MATYKEIQGEAIVNTSSDITSEGQVFYNTPGNAFKLSSTTTEAWASGGNLNTARTELGGFGTQTACVAAAGNTPPGDSNAAEEYNGTSWTNVSNLPESKKELSGGAGTESAGLICGGFSYPPFSIKTGTEEYDGSSWTAGGDMSTGRNNAGGGGSVPSAVVFGGGSPSAATEEYNGSSWTSGGALNEGRGSGIKGGTQGTQTAAIAMGGSPSNNTELYDGTSWTVATNLATPRGYGGPGGTQSSAILFGGSPMSNATEEFTGAGIAQTETIDVT